MIWRRASERRRAALLRLPRVGDNADMQTEPPKTDPPKRKRRWFQFSLRTLLILTAVVAVACCWLGRRIDQKCKEREAVESLVKLGGGVWYDYQFNSGRLSVAAEPPGPSWLRQLLGENLFYSVDSAYLVRPNWGEPAINGTITDAALACLHDLPDLRTLSLSHTKITDAALVHVKGLTRLENLSLDRTDVTGAGLENLTGLPRLETLGLAGSHVTDAGEAQDLLDHTARRLTVAGQAVPMIRVQRRALGFSAQRRANSRESFAGMSLMTCPSSLLTGASRHENRSV
jgi:hypothetical protein